MKQTVALKTLIGLASGQAFVYYYHHGVYNSDYKLTDYIYQSTDGLSEVYYNSGQQSTYGTIYQKEYEPLKEYYTFKKSYNINFDSIYFMEKNDHYG